MLAENLPAAAGAGKVLFARYFTRGIWGVKRFCLRKINDITDRLRDINDAAQKRKKPKTKKALDITFKKAHPRLKILVSGTGFEPVTQ